MIPASDFQVPCSAANEAALGRSLRVWRWFKGEFLQLSEQSAAGHSNKLRNCSAVELEPLTHEIDWKRVAGEVSEGLTEGFETDGSDGRRVVPLVGPPGSGIAEMLAALAQERQSPLLEAPETDRVLGEMDAEDLDLTAWDASGDSMLVIPSLERFYLRHESGLTLVRSLIERLASGGRVLVGCDSWAWAFLQQAAGIEDMLGPPMTLAPFDAPRLDAWLRGVYDLQQIEFVQRGRDAPVFPDCSKGSDSESEKSQPATSDLVKSFAAHSRGNPGVALALWTSCLRICDPDSDADGQDDDTSAGSTLWLVPPSELEVHAPDNGRNRIERFLLHTLLQHGGLSLATLVTLLPFSREQICRRLAELRLAGAVAERDGRFQVTLTAYPQIRRDLVGEGFLGDAF
ncbi:hypothetical protein Enr13x_45030 [Stieleria neptunia]|uniref:Uncharacterized protein n=1 Tax=Stieleria neptunia TaxID=2527979 RepID=A0A518HUU9_9BACT|nr:hypothetical protein [Stieleria neptunia]QDV44635.1 hypothetical protein Enr13x_45030 [Stieleria neptunia]